MRITYLASYIMFHGMTIGQEMGRSVYFIKQQMQWVPTHLCDSIHAYNGILHARGYQEAQKFA